MPFDYHHQQSSRQPSASATRSASWISTLSILAVAIATTTVAALYLQKTWQNSLKDVVLQAESALGNRISADRLHFQFGSLGITGLTLGTENNIHVKQVLVKLHINPFSSQFGRPKETVLKDVHVSAGADDLLRKFQARDRADSPTDHIASVKKNSRSASLKRLLTNWGRITFQHLHLKILDSTKNVLASCNNCGGTWDPDTREFQGSGQLETDYMNHQSFPTEFRASWNERKHTWFTQLEMTEPQNKGFVKVTVSLPHAAEAQLLKTKLELHNIHMEHPLLSTTKVGPINMSLTSDVRIPASQHGSSWIVDGVLRLHDKRVSALSKQDRPQLKLSYFLTSNRHGPHAESKLLVHLPTSSCSALSSLPQPLLGKLRDVSWQGETRGQWEASWKNNDWMNARIQQKQFQFGCSMAQPPHPFAASSIKPVARGRLQNASQTNQYLLKNEHPTFTPLSMISKPLKTSIVASEDRNFWKHGGVEFMSLASALKYNLQNRSVLVGASTISMQTAKNLFLDGRRTMARKIQEGLLTAHLETSLTKAQILETYLNIIEFGPNIYGIDAASQLYFGKSPAELNWRESNFLAYLLPSPRSRYGSFCQGELTQMEKSVIQQKLNHLAKARLMSPSDHLDARMTPLRFAHTQDLPMCRPLISHRKF